MNKIPTIIMPVRGNSSGNTWCRHYTGFFNRAQRNTTCAAGIEYDSVATPVDYYIKSQLGIPSRNRQAFPCIMGQHQLAKACPKQSFLTDEEVAERDRKADAESNNIDIARRAIVEYTNGKRGVSGKIGCPICNGNLQYAVASINGHIRARCSTVGCVNWIE